VLAVELANRESRSSWRDFLLGLKARGLHGVEFVVADDHAGLRTTLREVLAEAAYQRCYVHFLRNALDYVPRRVDDDCLQELRWLGACPRAGERRARGTGAISPRRAAIWRLGAPNGQANTPSSPAGSKRTSTRRSPPLSRGQAVLPAPAAAP
jgi:transposase-like protein